MPQVQSIHFESHKNIHYIQLRNEKRTRIKRKRKIAMKPAIRGKYRRLKDEAGIRG